MKIAVYAQTLGDLGGAAHYTLSLIRPLLRNHEVTLFHGPGGGAKPEVLRATFDRDLGSVRQVEAPSESSLPRLTRGFDLFINATYGSLAAGAAKHNALVVYFPLPLDDRRPDGRPLSGGERREQTVQRLQQQALQWIDRLDPAIGNRSFGEYRAEFSTVRAGTRLPLFVARSLAWKRRRELRLGSPALSSYQTIISIAEYTAHWVGRYFGRESVIIYPPIDWHTYRMAPKQKLILTVGRYEPGEMSKKHAEMLGVLTRLHDEGKLEGWRFVMCGGVGRDEAKRQYVEKLQERAQGYPVEILTDASVQQLRDLYARSAIYWHGMGFGEDREKTPWRYEHFGISTVEAMASGCIPVVIGYGGQSEIVVHGTSGFHWNSLEELGEHTLTITGMDAAKRTAMSHAARQRAEWFGEEEHERRMQAFYASVNVPVERDRAPATAELEPLAA